MKDCASVAFKDWKRKNHDIKQSERNGDTTSHRCKEIQNFTVTVAGTGLKKKSKFGLALLTFV